MNAPALQLRIGGLFAGVGGLDWGLELAGVGHVVWQVELDHYCRAVLAEHWPDVERHADIRLCGAHNLSPVEVLCGGFPCQDLSVAGAGAGLDGERSGLVWELLRIAREMEPVYIVLENVPALAARGLDRLLGALAESGYDAVWDHLPAAALGAPHRRDRLFLIAWISDPLRRRLLLARRGSLADTHGDGQPQPARGEPSERGWPGDGSPTTLADTHGKGWHLGAGARAQPTGRRQPPDGALVADTECGPAQLRSRNTPAHSGAALEDTQGERLQTPQRRGAARVPTGRPPQPAPSLLHGAAEPGLGGVLDGLPRGLDGVFPGWPAPRGAAQYAWEPPRLARPSKHAKARLRALGNAVVPPVAYIVGCWLIQLHTLLHPEDHP